MKHASGRSKRNNSVTAGRRTLYYLMTALHPPVPRRKPTYALHADPHILSRAGVRVPVHKKLPQGAAPVPQRLVLPAVVPVRALWLVHPVRAAVARAHRVRRYPLRHGGACRVSNGEHVRGGEARGAYLVAFAAGAPGARYRDGLRWRTGSPACRRPRCFWRCICSC